MTLLSSHGACSTPPGVEKVEKLPWPSVGPLGPLLGYDGPCAALWWSCGRVPGCVAGGAGAEVLPPVVQGGCWRGLA